LSYGHPGDHSVFVKLWEEGAVRNPGASTTFTPVTVLPVFSRQLVGMNAKHCDTNVVQAPGNEDSDNGTGEDKKYSQNVPPT